CCRRLRPPPGSAGSRRRCGPHTPIRRAVPGAEQPKYARVAKSFVNEDRTQAVFLLRMVEARHDKHRLEVVDDLRSIARKHGFKTALVGGIYYLQGRLAELVASSLVTGLFWLNVLFIGIAWIVARSVRGALAMIVSLS